MFINIENYFNIKTKFYLVISSASFTLKVNSYKI